MEFGLLIFALLSFFVRVQIAHLAIYAVHLVGLLWVIRQLVPLRPLTALFLVTYIGMYFPNPIAILLGWIPLEPVNTMNIFYTSDAMLLGGLDLFLIGVLRFNRHGHYASNMVPMKLNPVGTELVIMATLGLTGLGMLIAATTFAALGMDIFSVSKVVRHSYGAHNNAYLALAYTSMLLPFAAFLITLKPTYQQPAYWVPLGLLFVLLAWITRNRVGPIAVIVGIIVGWAVRNQLVVVGAQAIKTRFPAALKMFLLMTPPLLAFLVVFGKYARHSYNVEDWRFTPDKREYLMANTFQGGDLGFAEQLRHAIRLYPGSAEYLKGMSYYRPLFWPIPRSLWPTKPENPERLFARALDEELYRKNVTIPAGVVGDTYINFGFIGIIIMPIIGLAFSRERYRSVADCLYLAACGSWLFYFVRGNFANAVLIATFQWCAALVCRWALAEKPMTRSAPRLIAVPRAAVASWAKRGWRIVAAAPPGPPAPPGSAP